MKTLKGLVIKIKKINAYFRTTVAYAPTRIMSVNLADVLVPINWKEIRRAPAKQFSLPPPVVELSEDK